MDPSNLQKQNDPEEARFLDFPHLPDDAIYDGKSQLNKYSAIITRGHDFPGAKVRGHRWHSARRGIGKMLSEI